jgi:hypothetical protein
MRLVSSRKTHHRITVTCRKLRKQRGWWCPNLNLGTLLLLVVICIVVVDARFYKLLYLQYARTTWGAKFYPMGCLKNVFIPNDPMNHCVGPTVIDFCDFRRGHIQRFSVFGIRFELQALETKGLRRFVRGYQIGAEMGVRIPIINKMRSLTTDNYFNNSMTINMFCRRFSSIDQRPWNGEWLIVNRTKGSEVYFDPSSLILPHLALNRVNLSLESLDLFLTQPFGTNRIRDLGNGLIAKNSSLIAHFLNLHANKDSSAQGDQESELRQSVRAFGDCESLLFERFKTIIPNQPHEYWFGWFWIMLTFVDFVRVCHRIALLGRVLA